VHISCTFFYPLSPLFSTSPAFFSICLLQKAGAITEKERILAQIQAGRDVGVAKELANIKVPTVVMGGGSGPAGSSSNMTQDLINITLLKSMGVLGNKSPEKIKE
jgi:hypothetical protein